MIEANLKRFWNHDTETGDRVTRDNLMKIEFIFIRKDGWSIGCEYRDYDTVYNLYPETWKVILNITLPM